MYFLHQIGDTILAEFNSAEKQVCVFLLAVTHRTLGVYREVSKFIKEMFMLITLYNSQVS